VVTFFCTLGDQRFAVQHDTSHREALLRVPRPARVVVVAPPDWSIPDARVDVTATPLGDRGGRRGPTHLSVRQPGETPEVLFLPGRYRFQLEKIDHKSGERSVLAPSAELEVPAGELTRVRL
jgi:hypothetical protein